MLIEKLSAQSNIKALLEALKVDGGGKKILASKAEILLFSIKQLHVGAANILKQDALSIGADLAVPRGTIIAQEPFVDVLLIGTRKHMEILSRKELAQPFGLKDLAKKLREYLKVTASIKRQIMGILNANDDSFYAHSRFDNSSALERLELMIEEGADIIDIGGVSSKPGSVPVSANEELSRVKDIIDLISSEKFYEKVRFSIDSYAPEVVAYACERGFSIVNDITGLSSDEVCSITAANGASAVVMHMQGTPDVMQDNPSYENLLSEVSEFFEVRLEKAAHYKIEDVILDVGIGFGKTLEHNLSLIHNLEHFSYLGRELLVGASRKSMIDMISDSAVTDRLPGSLILHNKALENGASYLRVHDVKEHVQALRVFEALKVF